jgi:ribosomal protein S18 acetylase RimI-like enzyme
MLSGIKPMLAYQPATPDQIEELLRLMRLDASDYLDRTMQLMDMTWAQFSQRVRTVGQVFGVYRHNELVAFYWIEERERIVHLHGLVVSSAYQNQGIGAEILTTLAHKYARVMDAIELGVHETNTRARALYERIGYRTVKYLPDLGFYVLQRSLVEKEAIDSKS